MNCKFCQAELEEGVSVCPNCGELQPVQPKKNPSWLTALVIALGAVILIGMVAFIVLKMNKVSMEDAEESLEEQVELTVPSVSEAPQEPAGDPTSDASVPQETVPAEMTASDFLMYADVAARASYTAAGEALRADAQKVVATAGEFSLTNELLNVFYWVQFNEFMNTNGIYAYYMYGLDESKPLDSQKISGVDVTWEQYFLDSGMSLWYQCALLNTMAKEAGFALDADMMQVLDEMLVELEADALENGYADADALVSDAIGTGCTAQGYYDYMVFYWTAMYYYVELVEELAPADEQIRAYFEEHSADFAASGITAETAPYVDVRHILIMPKGGTTNVSGTTTYSEEEWETCRQAAQTILDTWTAGEATEDSFAALANEHSEDGGSNTTGGLYEGVTDEGKYVPEFEGWCIEKGRQPGDTGLVKTTYGYHVMYCSAVHEAWYMAAQQTMVQELYTQKMDQYMQDIPFEYDLSAVVLGGILVQETAPEATTPAQ